MTVYLTESIACNNSAQEILAGPVYAIGLGDSRKKRPLSAILCSSGNKWEVGRHKWIHIEKGELARILDAETDLVTRILVANWWMELDPPSGRLGLSRLGLTQREGSLLSTCSGLMTQQHGDALAAHAAEHLKTPGTPSGICLKAVTYLVALGQDLDLAPILELARGQDDKLARDTNFFPGTSESK